MQLYKPLNPGWKINNSGREGQKITCLLNYCTSQGATCYPDGEMMGGENFSLTTHNPINLFFFATDVHR
jgi:hypothetical protein